MRPTSILLTAVLAARPLLGDNAPAKVQSAAVAPKFATGETMVSPAPLARKLKSDLDSANALTRAALSRLKGLALPKTPTPAKLDMAKLIRELPCDHNLFRVEGAAADFQIQPGQLILLNGCFKESNAEVRIVGNFPPYGYLLLGVQDRGDTYFYGQVPDVTGVPDQDVSISVRFLSDGSSTNARSGHFRAKRQTWESGVNPGVCHALHAQVEGTDQPPWIQQGFPDVCSVGAEELGVDIWTSSRAASGYRITKFWWKAILVSNGISGWGKPPSGVRWSDDGSTVLVTHGKTWYGATRVQIEGPAGLAPY